LRLRITVKLPLRRLRLRFVQAKNRPAVRLQKAETGKRTRRSRNIMLSEEEINLLEAAADKSQAKIMGPDLFRAFVKNGKAAETK
jgi:hypothetical protein